MLTFDFIAKYNALCGKLRKSVHELGIVPNVAMLFSGTDQTTMYRYQYLSNYLNEYGIAARGYHINQVLHDLDGMTDILLDIQERKMNGIVLLDPFDADNKGLRDLIPPSKDIGNTVGSYASPMERAIWWLLENIYEKLQGESIVIMRDYNSSLTSVSPICQLVSLWGPITLCTDKPGVYADTYRSSVQELCKHAKLVISNVNKRGYLTKDMIPPETLVIDCGITVDGSFVYGDMDYPDKPSGTHIGPKVVLEMYALALIRNIVIACEE